MRLYIFLSVFFICSNCTAQTNDTAGAADLKLVLFGRAKLGDQRLSAKELKKTLYSVPAAIPYFRRSSVRRITGFSLLVPGTALAWIGRPGKTNDDGKSNTGYSIASIAFNATAVYFLISGFNQLKKAVKVYNAAKPITY